MIADRPSVDVLPRTLFVTPVAFNHFTGGGVTFSNLFRGWPRDRLFTVHADSLPLSDDVCANYFALGEEEVRPWGPIRLARALRAGRRRLRSRAPAPAPQSPDPTAGFAPAASGDAGRALRAGARLLFGPEGPPATARLSDRLAAWIEAARPEVIYTILGSIWMMELVEAIRRRFDLPVVVHIMDDWREQRHRKGLAGPMERRRMLSLFERTIREADGRLAICDAMARAYGARFGVPFEAYQNVVDTEGWLALARRDVRPGTPVRLLYAGSLYPGVQLDALLDAARAVERLRRDGRAVTLDVMCPDFMVAPHRGRLEAFEGTRVVPQVPREDYFTSLCRADILVLPVNFSDDTIRFVRYSMPTKIPEYLVSGVPVLLYGPAATAQIGYAAETGWGYCVTRPDRDALEAAIVRLAEDLPLRAALVERARRIAAERHAPEAVRSGFRAALRQAAAQRHDHGGPPRARHIPTPIRGRSTP